MDNFNSNFTDDGDWIYTPQISTVRQTTPEIVLPSQITPELNAHISQHQATTSALQEDTGYHYHNWVYEDLVADDNDTETNIQMENTLNPRQWRDYQNSNSIINNKTVNRCVENVWSVYGHDTIDISRDKSTPNVISHDTKSVEPIEVDKYYNPSTIRMTEAINGELYLSIPMVFKYVTLGGRLCERKRIELGNYIIEQNPHLKNRPKVLIQKINQITGEVKEINIKKYAWSDYGVIAKACLDWAHKNSDSIAF